MYREIRLGIVLSFMLFNMLMDEVKGRVTEGQESGLPKIMVYIDTIVIWELNKSTLQKKFQKSVTV
jgi:hypothetical protein